MEFSETIMNLIRKTDVIVSNSDEKVQLHILECVGALIHLQESREQTSKLLLAKQKVFWQTLSEVAMSALERWKEPTSVSSLQMLMKIFPNQKKAYDGRGWLPLHCAAACAKTDEKNIQIIGSSSCDELTRVDNDITKRTVFHFAAAVRDPNIAVIRQLKKFFYRMGRLTDGDGWLPLHYAARYSNSVHMVQELLQEYPQGALHQTDTGMFTPLHLVCLNSCPQTPYILRMILQSNSSAANVKDRDGNLPLHVACREVLCHNNEAQVDIIAMLLRANPASASVANSRGWCPLISAITNRLSIDAVKLVADAYPEGLVSSLHWCARGDNLSLLHYVHQRCPQAISDRSIFGSTPLHSAAAAAQSSCEMLQAVYSLDPSAIYDLGMLGRTPLYQLLHLNPYFSPVSNIADKFRFLLSKYPIEDVTSLCLTSRTALTICAEANNKYACRLILKAVPSLDPTKLQYLTYIERRMALFVFFSAHWRDGGDNIFTMLNGSTEGYSLIRKIVLFL